MAFGRLPMAEHVQTVPMLQGAVDTGDGRIMFTLFAPRKGRVALVGNFNGWNADANLLTQVSDGLWSIEKHLDPGAHYYQYLIDGTKICDPYAREVLWPPGGASNPEPPQAVLRVGAAPYQWRSDGWQRPAFRDLIIYETHVADFTPEGTFAAMTGRLDYIRDLGVNAIEMMPVTEDTFDEEWGYQPTYFFAVNHDYGTADDLKASSTQRTRDAWR